MFGRLRNRVYRFLRASERYTKTDMVYLTSGGFWLFLGQSVGVVAAFILAVAFANLIEPEKYGNYKYVLSLASIIGALTLTGLTTAVTRASARGFEGTLSYAFRLSLTWSIGMIFIAAALAAYYFARGNDFLGFSLLIIGATAPLIAASSLYRPFLMGQKQFKKASLWGVAQSLAPTLSVLAGIFFNAPLLALVALYFGTTALVLVILYMYARTHARNNTIDPDTNRLSKHLSVMGVISAAGERLDSVLIFQLLGGTELAIFTLATTMPDTLRGMTKNIDTLAMPKFAKKERQAMKRAVWSKTGIIFAGTLAVAFAYIVSAPYLFTVFFPHYLASIPYSQLYALTIPTSFALASAYFDSQGAVRERYILNITNTMVKIVSVVVGIVFFGLWGAVFARLFARVVNVSLSAFLIARH